MQQLSIHLCLFTFMILVVRVKQAHNGNSCFLRWLYVIALASLSMAYLQKSFSRMDGNLATAIDVWRESSLFIALALRVAMDSRGRIR